MPETARRLALAALRRIEQEGAYANLVLRAELDRSGLDERDRRFATDLVYGTTRMRRACDALVDRFIVREPSHELRTVLRLGAYQLVFLQVPPHAAVSATVSLAPTRQRGFVNAILRRVADTPMIWPDEPTRLSYPDWVVRRVCADLGTDEGLAALERMNEPAPVTRRDDGYVQDLASQLVVQTVGAQPGDRVWEPCAGPGGKATGLAATGAEVVAGDVRVARAGLVVRNAADLGLQLPVVVADAALPPVRDAAFDHVLVDAPCSGLGALRRRADARWRIQEADVDRLASLQRRILAASAPLVRIGGSLVYSVCTLTRAESVDHPTPHGFEVDPAPPEGPWRPFHQGWALYPHDRDTDGMVLLRYRRLA